MNGFHSFTFKRFIQMTMGLVPMPGTLGTRQESIAWQMNYMEKNVLCLPTWLESNARQWWLYCFSLILMITFHGTSSFLKWCPQVIKHLEEMMDISEQTCSMWVGVQPVFSMKRVYTHTQISTKYKSANNLLWTSLWLTFFCFLQSHDFYLFFLLQENKRTTCLIAGQLAGSGHCSLHPAWVTLEETMVITFLQI